MNWLELIHTNEKNDEDSNEFHKKIKDLNASSKSKSLNEFRKELKQRKKQSDEDTVFKKFEDACISLQTKGIKFYKNNQFNKAEYYLLQAMNRGLYSPNGLTYLTNIYRKKKEYINEIVVLENGLYCLKDDEENNYGNDILKLEDQLSKVKQPKMEQENE